MASFLYPLMFIPLFKEKPWGGQKLREVLGKDIPLHRGIGESWEISDRGRDSTPVANGPFAGQTLHSLVSQFEQRLLGDKVWASGIRRFPLLYKILDVEALLSLQVHPPDDYARRNENEGGKTEIWHVLEADPAASVVCGLREGIGREEFERLLREGRVEKALRQISINKGDTIFIPAGRLHAASPSCLLVEIQENSDLTYRVYDWGRTGLDGKPRSLHLKKALEVICFNKQEFPLVQPLSEKQGRNEIQLLAACPQFTVELLKLKEKYVDECSGQHFQVLTGLEGEGKLLVSELPGKQWKINPGGFILLPAYLGEYRIETAGGVNLLRSYI